MSAYEDLKSLVKKAYFDHDVARMSCKHTIPEVMRELRKTLPADWGIDLESLTQVKSSVLMAECYDYYGLFTDAELASNLGEKALSKVQRPPGSDGERELLQAKIRLAVAHARSLYRIPDYAAAERLLLQCRTVTKSALGDRKNFGIRGEIAYALGRVYRQKQRYADASREFNKAIEMYNLRSEQKNSDRTDDREQAEAFSRHKVATIVALGLAWCNYTQGALGAAMYGNLIPARMLLKRSGDVLNSAYADVIYASTARALIGKDIKKLNELRALVIEAQNIFKKYDHKHYVAGTALELALIALATGDTETADRDLYPLEKPPIDKRWLLSARIVQSRIARHNNDYQSALAKAKDALKTARKRKEPLAEIEALIARSEARSDKENELARADLQRALKLNQAAEERGTSFNPKIHAICHLHLMERYLRMKKLSDAYRSYAEWCTVRGAVEHFNIREKAERLATKLGAQKKLCIDTDGPQGLDDDRNVALLREFLLRKAKIRHRTDRDVIDALGITAPTLKIWEKLYDKRPDA